MRELKDLSQTESRAIARIFRDHGTAPAVVRTVVGRFGISESSARAMVEAATGKTPASSAPTTHESVVDRAKIREAQVLADRANAAEARGLDKASLQELAAIAALNFT